MNDMFALPELLAIVEVDKSNRVVCQAPGCGHAVYKRIHVVREGGFASVYGSDCFGRLFAGVILDVEPRYGNSGGRLLSSEERALLTTNTERLIAQFETALALALESQRLRREQQTVMTRDAAENVQKAESAAELRRPLSPAQNAADELEAKRIVREKYQVDGDQPGWRGLVMAEKDKLLLARAAQTSK